MNTLVIKLKFAVHRAQYTKRKLDELCLYFNLDKIWWTRVKNKQNNAQTMKIKRKKKLKIRRKKHQKSFLCSEYNKYTSQQKKKEKKKETLKQQQQRQQQKKEKSWSSLKSGMRKFFAEMGKNNNSHFPTAISLLNLIFFSIYSETIQI